MFFKYKKWIERASCHDDRSVRIYQSQKVPLGLSRKRLGKDTWFQSWQMSQIRGVLLDLSSAKIFIF